MLREIVIVFIATWFTNVHGNHTAFYVEELKGLSELPLEKLIQIKSSLVQEEEFDEEGSADMEMSSRELSYTLPMAMPLKGGKWPVRRYEEHYEEKGKDTKISKIFQLAVTSLSFLAFGGYLLTLIITAIRRNSAPTGTGNVIVLSNLQSLQKYTRPKRDVLNLDPLENDWRMKRLYEGMLLLSEAYVQNHSL